MIYLYKCTDCQKEFDVVKPLAELDRAESCDACGSWKVGRQISHKIQIMGAKVQEKSYNPGLGCVVNNKEHQAQIVKERGLIEVGNEKADTIHRETVVKKEIQREKEWSEL